MVVMRRSRPKTPSGLLRVIRRAAREGWDGLDLSVNGIAELPDEIGQLTNLQSLILSGNPLTALPESIGQLTNLRVYT